jgi:hypothetical protein
MVGEDAGPAPVDGAGEQEQRNAERHRIVEGITIMLDGNPATLVDLSLYGAQVITSVTLKPNQRVRLLLPTPKRVRIGASVRWANFEIPAGGPCYRAGLKFIDADGQAIAEFIDSHKQT